MRYAHFHMGEGNCTLTYWNPGKATTSHACPEHAAGSVLWTQSGKLERNAFPTTSSEHNPSSRRHFIMAAKHAQHA